MSTETVEIPRWGIVELLGHNQCAGLISAEEIAGAKMLLVRIPRDPTEEDPDLWRPVYFTPSAVYAVHFCDETRARLANNARPYSAQHDDDIEDFLAQVTNRLTGESRERIPRTQSQREEERAKHRALEDAIEPIVRRAMRRTQQQDLEQQLNLARVTLTSEALDKMQRKIAAEMQIPEPLLTKIDMKLHAPFGGVLDVKTT